MNGKEDKIYRIVGETGSTAWLAIKLATTNLRAEDRKGIKTIGDLLEFMAISTNEVRKHISPKDLATLHEKFGIAQTLQIDSKGSKKVQG